MTEHSYTCTIPEKAPLVLKSGEISKADAKKAILESGLPPSLANEDLAKRVGGMSDGRFRTAEILAMRHIKNLYVIGNTQLGYESAEDLQTRRAAFDKILKETIADASGTTNFYREKLKALLTKMGESGAPACAISPPVK